MVDELFDGAAAAGLRLRAYVLEDGSTDCTPDVLREWQSRRPVDVVRVPPPPPAAEGAAWAEHTKGAYQLNRDEAVRQRRYQQMALLRDHLTKFVLDDPTFQADVVAAYDADQGSGWASANILKGIGAVASGRYDSICGNGIVAQANPHRFVHRDLLALRISDFEDQPDAGVELAAPGPAWDDGARNVAACFGGLAVYDASIFRDDGCSYDYGHVPGSNDWDCEHVVLARCLADHGRSTTLLPNLIINGPFLTTKRRRIVRRWAPDGSARDHL